MQQVEYRIEPDLSKEEFCDLLKRSGLDERRPVESPGQIETMLREADIILTARVTPPPSPNGPLPGPKPDDTARLVGVSRAITDHAYCTYLSDLAIDREFQRQGIGKRLIDETHRHAGLTSRLILLSAPAATQYYPHIGMEQHNSCWTIPPLEASHELPARVSLETTANTAEAESVSAPEGQEELAEFFDGLADEYDEAILRCFPRYPELLQTVTDYIPPDLSPARIADLGCGSGTLAVKLANRFPNAHLTLVDLSKESLKLADSRLPDPVARKLVCSDMSTVQFDEGSLDVIVSTIAIHHLPADSKRKLFANCYRWLSPGGVMVFGDQCSGLTGASTAQHHKTWQTISRQAGSTADEWSSWMQHQEDCDHHESIPDLFEKLHSAGFGNVDIVWRYLLWTVFVANR